MGFEKCNTHTDAEFLRFQGARYRKLDPERYPDEIIFRRAHSGIIKDQIVWEAERFFVTVERIQINGNQKL